MWGDFLLEMLSLYKQKHKTIFTFLKRGEVLCHNLIGVLPEYPVGESDFSGVVYEKNNKLE